MNLATLEYEFAARVEQVEFTAVVRKQGERSYGWGRRWTGSWRRSSCLRARDLLTELRAEVFSEGRWIARTDLEPILYDPYDPSQHEGGRRHIEGRR